MTLMIRLLVLLLLWKFVPPPSPLIAEGHPTIQCAQTGGAFLTKKAAQIGRAWHLRQGSFTIGALKFDSKYGGAIYSGFAIDGRVDRLFFKNRYSGWEKPDCPYSVNENSVWELQLCDEKNTRVILKMSAVQQTDPSSGKLMTLNGWLHIEVELVDKTDSIRMLYMQMYDEYFNAVGEFVKDPTEQCPSSDPQNYVSPTEYQLLPCSAVGAREAKPSQAVYMVHSSHLIDKSLTGSRYLPPKEINRFVHVTWRMNEYWCSRHLRIVPMVFLLTQKNVDDWRKVTHDGALSENDFFPMRKLGWWKLYRKIPKYWLLPDWIGAADVKHPERGALQCNNSIYEAPWVRGKLKHSVRQEFLHHSNLYEFEEHYWGSNTCQQNPFFIENYSKFVGRCKAHVGKETSHDILHKCNTNSKSPEFQGLNVTFSKYTEYVNNLTTVRKETCHQPCRAPQTVEDAINISRLEAAFTKPSIDIGHGLIHNTRSKTSIAKFWRGRKFHGIACLIVTMFLMPVSNFLARYYKETYMRHQFKGIHAWYWLHAGGSIGSLGVLYGGHFAMSHQLESWGRSKSSYAILHHALGWISVFSQILMVMYGGIRSAVLKRRKCLMKAHSIFGFTLYIFNLLLIVSSTYIPASPSLRQCDRDGFPTGFSVTLWITMVWIGLDTIFHFFLTCLQMTADRTLQIKRPLSYCPILPILDPNSHEDMRRSGLRKLLLYFYLFLSVVITLGATIHLAASTQPDGCIIGEMSCKAALGCTRVGLAMCRKLKYKVCTGGSQFTFPI